MVTQNMLRTHKEKCLFGEEKNPICSRFNQMPKPGQITEVGPYACTDF